MKVVVIGAGLAGLTCAKVLARGGVEVVVLEASDGVGGRVRTDEREGFLLDRGFQVYFSAYPVSRRHLDHGALDLMPFDPGAVVHHGGRRSVLSDPLRDPGAVLPSLRSDAATFADKLRTLGLAAGRALEGGESAGRLNGEVDVSSLSYLREKGFSEQILNSFYRPFYGGIFLDRSLSTSARVLRFTFKMLATGKIAVPARGIGEIPKQLAGGLPENAIHTGSPVLRLLREGDRVVGAETAREQHEADAVVVATDAPMAGKLTGRPLPEDGLDQVCVYYVVGGGFLASKKISLNAEGGAFVNNAVEISAVAPLYAPRGERLLSVTVLEGLQLSDEEVFRYGADEVHRWHPGADLSPLAVYRIPFAQFDQPPGIHERLPGNRTGTPGLFLAGEYTEDSSINGSMLSGERAAWEVMRG